MELWLLFPIVTQIEPSWIRLFDDCNLSAAAPALQLLLARDCVAHVAKVLNPNEPIQMIAFREALRLTAPMLVQPACDVTCNPDIQCGAVFVGENVDPIVVIAHATQVIRNVSLSLNMTEGRVQKSSGSFLGSSMHSFTLMRKVTASFPSTRR
jgi:hypothetical protein